MGTHLDALETSDFAVADARLFCQYADRVFLADFWRGNRDSNQAYGS